MTSDDPKDRAPRDLDDGPSARWLDHAARSAGRAYEAAYGREIPDDSTRMRWRIEPRVAATAAVAIVVVAAVGWWLHGASSTPVAPIAVSMTPRPEATPPEAAPSPAMYLVHVSGAVGTPGLVPVTPGSRIADAIDAAGGLDGNADVAQVNLAREVRDGEHVHVPEVGEAPTADGPVDLNSADAATLESLPGIGPVLAQRIVDDREANGPFASVGDLERVSGVGSALVDGLGDAAVA